MSVNTAYPHNLASLPPNVDFKNPKFIDLIIEARSQLGELKGYSFSMPNPLLLLSPAIIKESLASSEIENINTTMIDVLENQLFPESEQRKPDTEVLRYRDAVLEGFENMSKDSLSTRTIQKILKTLITESNGEYRRAQNAIKNDHTGRIVYVPPETSKINHLLGNLENFINDSNKDSMDPLIRCAIAHYQFEAIHPFSDGNGRTGRILIVLQLINSGVLSLPILYISGYINKHKNDYYRLLQEVTTKGNWDEYLLFMLKGFALQARETKELLFKIMKLFSEHKKDLKQNHKNIYSADLVEALFSFPIVTSARLSVELGIHRNTATKYLLELEKSGMLTSRKMGKYHFFANKQLINIIHGD